MSNDNNLPTKADTNSRKETPQFTGNEFDWAASAYAVLSPDEFDKVMQKAYGSEDRGGGFVNR